MDRRTRYFAAARRQPVDRIPTHFRASKVLVRRLMEHFSIDPAGSLASADALLDCLGADHWASGCPSSRPLITTSTGKPQRTQSAPR